MVTQVYREIDKKSGNPPTSSDPSTNSSPENQNPMQLPESSSMGMDMQDLSRPLSSAGVPVLGGGALNRPRSAIDGRRMTRDRERQLVGSLTNSTVFKEGGLVKKVSGFKAPVLIADHVGDNQQLRSTYGVVLHH